MFALKIITTVFFVFCLTWIAEKIDIKLAGVLSGMPLGALLVFTFIGLEVGENFVSKSAIYAIPAVSSTLSFSLVYFFISQKALKFNPILSTIGGITAYFLVALILRNLNFNIFSGLTIAILSILIANHLLRRVLDKRILYPVPINLTQLILRTIISASTVIGITEFSLFLGPEWSGLLVAFPITLLPFFIIIHISYGYQYVHTIIQNLPLGLGGLTTFLVAISLSINNFGTIFGITFSLTMSIGYLFLLNLLIRWNRKI